MDGRVSGQFVSASAGDGREDAGTCWDYAVGADGFSITGPDVARRAGLSQPQGSSFESGPAEVGVLYAAEVLSEDFRGRRTKSLTAKGTKVHEGKTTQACVRS